jgi:hypothetical protein
MIERPLYYVEKRIDDFVEIRKYSESKWITVTANANEIQYLNNYAVLMYNKLAGYIQGENNRNEKITVTQPVTFHLKVCVN